MLLVNLRRKHRKRVYIYLYQNKILKVFKYPYFKAHFYKNHIHFILHISKHILSFCRLYIFKSCQNKRKPPLLRISVYLIFLIVISYFSSFIYHRQSLIRNFALVKVHFINFQILNDIMIARHHSKYLKLLPSNVRHFKHYDFKRLHKVHVKNHSKFRFPVVILYYIFNSYFNNYY